MQLDLCVPINRIFFFYINRVNFCDSNGTSTKQLNFTKKEQLYYFFISKMKIDQSPQKNRLNGICLHFSQKKNYRILCRINGVRKKGWGSTVWSKYRFKDYEIMNGIYGGKPACAVLHITRTRQFGLRCSFSLSF